MRTLELTSKLQVPPDEAWAFFLDVEAWPSWGRLVLRAEGDFRPGARWKMTLAGRGRPLRPYLVSVDPPRNIVFETRLIGCRIRHAFTFAAAPSGSVLRQTFVASGPTEPLLRPWTMPGMRQFSALGDDLARALQTASPREVASCVVRQITTGQRVS
ncbi:MAG: SRPBCC family protein [Myxococcales bacterium]|nr:SRPBCC family protein [Myxococcales bacterium]